MTTWKKEVNDVITARCQLFKSWYFWKVDKCTRASYNTAKHISRRVHNARHKADKVVYENIDHMAFIFRLANQMRKDNIGALGDMLVKNDTRKMSMSDETKQNRWDASQRRV